MATYSLTVVNNSQISGNFAIFQQAPPTSVPGNVFSLAWVARPATPFSREAFTWGLDYSLVGSETGVMQPGIVSSGRQNPPDDTNRPYFAQLTQDNQGATTFANVASMGALGSLTVQPENVAPDRTSVGVGMAGSGTFAVQAAPNMTAVFTPHPNSWVISGNYQTGDVMDIKDGTSAVEVSGGD